MRYRQKLLICIFVVSITVHVFGTNLVAYKFEPYSQKQNGTEVLDTQYFLDLETQIGKSSFGGVVFEEDVLIIHIVKDTDFDKSKINQITGQQMDIRDVKYSLSLLEEVKDFLTKYMDGGEILALDANEARNTVDIYLSTYNHNLISEMSDDVQKRFTENEYLNFIDSSGTSIGSTVAYEKPNYKGISQNFHTAHQSP